MIIFLFITGVSGLISLFCFLKARKNNNRLKAVFNYFQIKNPAIEKSFNESISFGGVLTGLTVLDIFLVKDNWEQVFETLEYRFPNELGDYSTLDWFQKVSDFQSASQRTIDGYASAFTGQAAEFQSLQFLEKNDFTNVELFESRINPHNDIHAISPEGDYVEMSVKAYTEQGSFLNAISDSDAHTHIVNEELYEQLEKSGELLELKAKGIDILNGNFSHLDNKELAYEAFSDLAEAGDTSSSIPVIALITYGISSSLRLNKYKNGTLSGDEFLVDQVADTAKKVANGTSSFIGGKAGMVIGTAIMPGLGTVVGGLIGGIAGYFTSSSTIGANIEEQAIEAKWGDIIKALDRVGTRYKDFFDQHVDFQTNPLIAEMTNSYFKTNKYDKRRQDQIIQYNSQMNFMKRIGLKSLTFNEALLIASSKRIEQYLTQAMQATNHAADVIKNQIERKVLIAKDANKKMLKERMLAEVLIENENLVSNSLNDLDKELIKKYQSQKGQNPNHPYRVSSDSKKLLVGLINEKFLANKPIPIQPTKNSWQGIYLASTIMLMTAFTIAIYIKYYHN